MKNKIVIINRRFVRINYTLLFGVAFIIFTLIIAPISGEDFYGYAAIAIILIILLFGWFLCPICCVVNANGVKLVYALRKNEFTDFKQIRKIYICDDEMYRGSFISRCNYVFDGLKLNRKYMTNEFMKCKKLENALLLYAKEKLNNNLPK